MAEPRRLSRSDAERKGRQAEHLAALLLRLKGFRILEARYRCPQGEVDLIARRGDLLIFCEVKARARHEDGQWAITPTAEQRIMAAAQIWQSRHPKLRVDRLRFDLITVANGWPRHHPDAWRPDARTQRRPDSHI